MKGIQNFFHFTITVSGINFSNYRIQHPQLFCINKAQNLIFLKKRALLEIKKLVELLTVVDPRYFPSVGPMFKENYGAPTK